MTSYTTVTEISNELNGYTLNSTTVPSSTTVSGWIEEASKEIDLRTNTIWSSATVSSEYYDYDGSGMLRLDKSPTISMTEVLAESSGIDASSATWYELEEGRIRTKDFIFYPEEGELLFHGTQKPIAGRQNICLTYVWGQTSTPVDIKRLATLITAKRTIQTIVGGSATNEGGSVSVGTISVSDPSEFGNRRLERMGTEIDRLFRVVGDMKTYRLNRVY